MFAPLQSQELGSDASCPKNPFGHSWKGVDWLEGRIQQRCRFCQRTRAVRLPPSELREQQARQGP